MHTCCRLYLISVNEGNIRENAHPIALHIFIQLFVAEYVYVYIQRVNVFLPKYNFSRAKRNLSCKIYQLQSINFCFIGVFSNSSLWYIKAKCLYNVLFFIILYHVYPQILCIFDIKLPVHLYFSLQNAVQISLPAKNTLNCPTR